MWGWNLIERAWPALAGLIVGYLVGGWIYEAAGDHVWAKPANLIYDYQILVAGAFALVAAWIAWRAALRTIEADDNRQRRSRTQRLVAAGDVLTTEMMMMADVASSGDPSLE